MQKGRAKGRVYTQRFIEIVQANPEVDVWYEGRIGVFPLVIARLPDGRVMVETTRGIYVPFVAAVHNYRVLKVKIMGLINPSYRMVHRIRTREEPYWVRGNTLQ